MYLTTTVWASAHAYAHGAYVVPPAGYETGFIYRCNVAGTSAGSPPAFPAAFARTVTDGTVTWICAATAPLFTQSDLEDYLSAFITREGTDDNNDGAADSNVIDRLRWDATSYVYAGIGGNYHFPMGSPFPNELQRLGLAAAKAMFAERHPEILRIATAELYDRIDGQLDKMTKAIRRLDIPPMHPQSNLPPVIEKPGNVGGVVRSGDPASPTPKPKMFVDGMGDF